MPTFDLKCTSCGLEREHLVRGALPACSQCGAPTEKYWSTRFPSVLGDEIDETVENLTATPQHFTSRAEKRLWLKMHGVEERVRHVGMPGEGSDKSPHTTSWAAGLPPGVDGRPMSMLSAEEQEARHREWMTA